MKKRIFPVLLSLLLILCACGTQTKPVSSAVVVSSSSPDSSLPFSMSSQVNEESSLSSELPSGSSSESISSYIKQDKPVSSQLPNPESRAPASASSHVTLSSSLPPLAPPKTTAKPLPPVTAKMPQASGSSLFERQGCAVDFSNAAEGYVMVKYSGSSKVKVLVYFNGGSSYYQYNISGNGSYVTLPLQSGSGSYRIRFMENVSGDSYAELCSTELSASVTGSGYTLYPNQYAQYTRSSAAVVKAKSLCANATSNSGKVSTIYRYITANIKYDYSKTKSVQPGYLPNVDSTLSTKKGICFDYAALMATMCRSQGIPTKLVIGQTSVGYHAWNEVYLGGWKRYDATFGAVGQSAGTYTAQKYY